MLLFRIMQKNKDENMNNRMKNIMKRGRQKKVYYTTLIKKNEWMI